MNEHRIWIKEFADWAYADGNGGYICPNCMGVIGSIGCCLFKEKNNGA